MDAPSVSNTASHAPLSKLSFIHCSIWQSPSPTSSPIVESSAVGDQWHHCNPHTNEWSARGVPRRRTGAPGKHTVCVKKGVHIMPIL
jgi:hypothetical protein